MKHEDKVFHIIELVMLALFLAVQILGLCALRDYVNNSKENEEPAGGEVLSAEYQANTPDDHAPPQNSHFDVTYLDFWCGEPTGTIRMIGGWYYAENEIETEDGYLWELNTESINPYEFLLIWFDDMNTPDITDDQIVKVWSEVYD